MWGSTPAQRKPHLVNWETLCLPKSLGGLGFKKIPHMNEAFILKLVWDIVSRPNDLWVLEMRGKYARNSNLMHGVTYSGGDSVFWKSIHDVWPILLDNIKYDVGDGSTMLLWKDVWLDRGLSLEQWCPPNLSLADQYTLVRDFLCENGCWDLERLHDLIHSQVVLKINASLPLSPSDGEDCIA